MHIRTRLLTLVLSTFIPALVAATIAVWFVYEEAESAQTRGLTEAARATALLVDKEMETTEGILKTLASSPALANDDWNAFYEHAKRIAPPEYTAVVLTDLNGHQLLNTRVPPGGKLPVRSSNLAALRHQYGPQQTIISDLFVMPLTQKYGFAVEVPLMRDQQVRYYLSIGIPAERLNQLLTQVSLPAGWFGSIVDRQGFVVARSEGTQSYVGKQARPALLKRILAGERSGIHYGVALDGRKTAGFFSRAPHAGWTVLINVPRTEMRKPALYASAFLGTILLLLLLGAVVAARWYGRRTAQPIEQLRIAAEHLGEGKLITPAATGLVETDAVSRAMADAGMQLHQNRVEMERRIAEAVASAERAERALLQSQKLEALGRLTAGIAHDFNNVLQTLTSALDLICLYSDSQRIQSLVDTCNRAIERATALTGQMRAFGRAQEATIETIHLNDRLETMRAMLRNALPSNIELNIRVEADIWLVAVDPLQLELALLNLVLNSRDAMPRGGRVTIEACNEPGAPQSTTLPPGDYVCIKVTDTGSGMSADVTAKALEPFFTTKSVDKGSGLGLPQAYGFATQAGGTLVLQSEEGRGTTVTLYLPRAKVVSVDPVRHTPTTGARTGGGVLLFVEDDPLVRNSVTQALRVAGFKVAVATNAEEALALLDAGCVPDQLFSDIVMPGSMDGVQLARAVRDRFPHIRVVLASGYTDTQINLPDIRVLAKPYKVDDAIRLLSGAA